MTKIGKQSEIISLSNGTIKTISSLSHRKYRKELHLFIAEGIRVCKEALDNGWSFKYFLFDKSNVDNILINELINKIISKGGDIIGVTPDILKKISHKNNPQNVLGVIEQKQSTLPLNLYQIQVKFRDEARPRAGLLRGREFHMKDAYSFDIDQNGLDKRYDQMVEVYKSIFQKCGLPVLVVQADSGAIGGKDSQNLIYN